MRSPEPHAVRRPQHSALFRSATNSQPSYPRLTKAIGVSYERLRSMMCALPFVYALLAYANRTVIRETSAPMSRTLMYLRAALVALSLLFALPRAADAQTDWESAKGHVQILLWPPFSQAAHKVPPRKRFTMRSSPGPARGSSLVESPTSTPRISRGP